MRMIAIMAAVGALALAGCTTAQKDSAWSKISDFLGSADRCEQGAILHAAFATIAAKNPKVAARKKEEAAFYAAFREQCADGKLNKLSLQKALNAYVAALDELKK